MTIAIAVGSSLESVDGMKTWVIGIRMPMKNGDVNGSQPACRGIVQGVQHPSTGIPENSCVRLVSAVLITKPIKIDGCGTITNSFDYGANGNRISTIATTDRYSGYDGQ